MLNIVKKKISSIRDVLSHSMCARIDKLIQMCYFYPSCVTCHLATTFGSFSYCKSSRRLGYAAVGGFMSDGVKKTIIFCFKKSNFCFFLSTNVILKYIKQSKSLNIYKPFRFLTGSALTSGCNSNKTNK